jgi:hypothetical protein
MNLGVTLNAAEKVFGPALPGPGSHQNTLSAVRYAEGKSKKFAGILGIHDNANFYIHFPTPVEWNLLESKKGVPDFVNDLKESGPQGQQGRTAQVAKFMGQYESMKAKRRLKQEAAQKKALIARRKEEAVLLRSRLAPYAGEQEVTLIIGQESISMSMKITVDKKGKVKIAATL